MVSYRQQSELIADSCSSDSFILHTSQQYNRITHRVCLKNLTGNRRVNIRCSLHGLHRAEGVGGDELLAYSGKIYEHNISKGVGSMGSDSDSSDITINLIQ